MPLKFKLATAILIVLVVPSIVSANKISDLRKARDELNKDITAQENKAQKALEEEKQLDAEAYKIKKELRSLEKQINSTAKSLAKINSELRFIRNRVDSVTRDIKVIKDKLEEAQKQLIRRRNLLVNRLRAMSLYGEPDWLSSLLAFGDISVSFEIWDGLSRIADYDHQLMLEINARKSIIQRDRTDLEGKQHTLHGAQKKKLIIHQEQTRQKKEFDGHAKKLRVSRQSIELRKKVLANEREMLKKFLDTIKKKRALVQADIELMKKKFKQRKGKLPWPVKKVAIISVRPYGKYKHGSGITLMNKGLDIFTKKYQNVIAVSRGEVVFAGWYGRMGNLVIIDHGGDYNTLYGHLADISVHLGQEVEMKDVIGKTGNTGSLEKGSLLHFELLKGAKAVNPKRWLSKE